MHRLLFSAMALALAGCALSPPKPPLPTGEYRPINTPSAIDSSKALDFSYEGDILGVLAALQAVAPQVTALPPVGQPEPQPVRVSVRKGTLDEVLSAIADQSRGVADVVLTTTRQGNGSQVHLRFQAAKEVNTTN